MSNAPVKAPPIESLVVHYLFPIDLGMDLELDVKDRRFSKEVTRHFQAGEIFYQGKSLGQSQLTAHLYPFGTGMLELSVNYTGDLQAASELAINAEKLHVGRMSLLVFFHSQINAVLEKAKSHARSMSAARLEPGREIFNLFSLPWKENLGAEAFLRKNNKTLFGIVTGEPSYARLSEYALTREELKNIGYYDQEIILINHFGAFLHSPEDEMLHDLVSLAFAQYFNVGAANAFLEKSLLAAHRVLEDQPAYYRFWKMPKLYQRISREQREFGRAKAALVEGLHALHHQIPEIESDWHLQSVHREILSSFDIDEQAKTASVRLETIDSIYSNLGEQLSTMFFIFLDFVFLAWLVVDLVGWIALIAATKTK
ncbi:MAG: hypothetical protein HY547_07445 [Elusimicrobia bacterium]|nr:hypothetical protein [Elusimicrobiota bacterium]